MSEIYFNKQNFCPESNFILAGIILAKFHVKYSMKKVFLILAFIILLLNSCTKDEVKIDPENLLIGIWTYTGYEENEEVFTRSQMFTDNRCYRFNSDGTLTERKNSGWCGTPPISYSDYRGNWTIINDTLIRIRAGYWGGTMTYRLDIEEINSNVMKVMAIADDE